jgi:ADP-heptose:LPS heptosyltransferase
LGKKHNARIVITGADEDRQLAEEFVQKCRIKPVNAVGRTSLLELAALIEKCSVYITSDSAPLHIASAVKTPYVALFGPTDPKRHAPPGRGIILRKNLKCSPCYSSQCRDYDCMKKINVEEVAGSAEEFLNK